MAKNITIAEGGVSRNFTAKKLKTNLQGGGNCTWIPEDEAADYCTFKELKVTANGTYKASDKNCDGFDKVKVEVPSDVLPQKTITTNGEYDAMQDDGRMGYAHVTVNVPGGGGGPFTVLFLDDEGNVLKKQKNVPYGGYASCTELDGTILNGLYFKGWNPMPKNVQFNMTCRPVRGDYVITPGEIADDWETIVADGGAHYPLGSYKPLVITVPADANFQHVVNNVCVYNGSSIMGYYDNAIYQTNSIPLCNIALHMVKVAEGEDGSTSSWLSDGLINVQALGFQNVEYAQADFQTNIGICTDWINHPFRKWLNENLYDAMPIAIKNAIKDVDKAFKSYNIAPEVGWHQSLGGVQLLDKSSIDKIWVPSMAEMKTIVEAASNYSSYSQYMELEGIDYSQVFVPAYGAVRAGFRTAALPGGYWDTMPPKYIHYRSDQGLADANYEYAPFGFCL